MLLFAFHVMFLFLGNVTNIPAVLHPSSSSQGFRLLTICCQHFKHQPIVFCVVRPTHTSLALAMGAVSLFSTPAAALVSRRSRTCTSLTKSEEKERLLAVYQETDSTERQISAGNKEAPTKRYAVYSACNGAHL